MNLSEEKEFELLVKSIEDAAKHARSLLFFLVISSVYVLVAAFSKTVAKQINLPVLNAPVETSYFFAISPVVILGIYLYLHIYIRELTNRLTVFDSLLVACPNVPSPRLLLFPWLFIFSNQRTNSLFLTLVSNTIIWFFGPIVLFSLWLGYVGQEHISSIIPCLCLIASIFSTTSGHVSQKASGWASGFSGIVLLFITIASVPDYREFFVFEFAWSFFKEILPSGISFPLEIIGIIVGLYSVFIAFKANFHRIYRKSFR
ncbi:MAG: hypothetical protein IH977_13835 [Nitrospinae bacterium]|nr:hypothetical protein [Nitrospinota bacterium]